MTPKRLILTGCCLALVALAWMFVKKASAVGGNITGGVGYGIFAAAMVIAAGVLFSMAYLEYFTFPFSRYIDAVFGLLPDERKPPLDLAIADRLEQREGSEAAEREYLRLLDYYPRSLEVWMRLIALRSEAYGVDAANATRLQARRELKRDRAALRILDRMEKSSKRLEVTAGNS